MVLVQAYICSFVADVAKRMRAPRRGQGLVEYGLIIAVIAAAGIAGLAILGPKLQDTLTTVSGFFPGASTPTP